MTSLDWVVIGLYMLGMLAVGKYYERHTQTADDYLLGGRRMGPTSVGLSLFASLLSTISYLAVPGEMIRHGPLVFTDILIYPAVFVIVGFVLIPRFMSLHVTSAYELLERRLGLGIRLLGSCLFLVMRLLWMGVIVYATTSQVLVPLMKLPEWSTPWICIVMGLFTVAYSSMGGLPAVVITDAIQSLILLFGAVLTLIVITTSLGGIDQWWPTHWPSHWDTFQIRPSAQSRVSVALAAFSGFCWWICMGGSDQIAIQRYLSTRDAPAARRMFGISLLTSSLAIALLAMVGLALLAYFQKHPQLLADGVGISANADLLFPRFIVLGLPAGVTGLIVAGLLAAAMSSLSAGLSSSCLVIAIDLWGRLTNRNERDLDFVKHTRAITWSVGIIVVVTSTLVGLVRGNLLEMSFKVANLLTAPLFVLFFLAMFVPWATALGAWTATLISVGVSVAIAVDGVPGVSFLWITPAGLISGILVGCLASAIPLGRGLRWEGLRQVK